MKLEKVTYFRLPRDEDGRRTREFEDMFVSALRWTPELGELREQGMSALRSLNEGDAISGDRYNTASTYLRAAIVHYRMLTDEPYPGRNKEAVADLEALLDEVRV